MQKLKHLIAYLKKHKKWVIAVAILIASAAFFFRPKSAPPIPTQVIKRDDLKQTVTATGSVVAKKSVNLTFQIPGLVSYVGVKKGDYVEAYQTIAVIDQRTTLKNLQTKLLDYNIQRNTFDQTISDNRVKSPKDALNDSMKRILESNQYNLDKAIASVELQDLAKQQAILTTPIAGIVSRADIEIAGVVAPVNTTYIVVDPESVVFEMDVDEADIAKIQEGQIVTIVLDAYPEKELNLEVASIDFASHTTSTGGTAYTVGAILGSNDNYEYRIGMRGDGEIHIREEKDVITVPLVAVFDDNHVYLKTKKGYENRKISLGLQNDTDAQVISGLAIGDVVVLQPNLVQNPR